MRKWMIAGNWKMNKTFSESLDFVKGLSEHLANVQDRDILVCPPSLSLVGLAQELKGSSIAVGAQNMWYEDSGAYTGEVSADMLLDAKVAHVILGHSERRQIFGETDELVNQKTHKALSKGLVPIVCVGESLEDRESGRTEAVVGEQIKASLAGVTSESIAKLVVAYEPIWAIGTGMTATTQQAQDVHAFIRNLSEELWGDAASQLRILYGGSVKPSNSQDLLSQQDIDGLLVGGASLKIEDFASIVLS